MAHDVEIEMTTCQGDIVERTATIAGHQCDMHSGMFAFGHYVAAGFYPRPSGSKTAGFHAFGNVGCHPGIVELDRGAGCTEAERRGEEDDLGLFTMRIGGTKRLPKRIVIRLDCGHGCRVVSLAR
nr:hypothetical protein [Xaviernesmea rhizosphaerae]